MVAGLAAALIGAPVACGGESCIEGWCSVDVPNPPANFGGVWGSGNDDVWVVGDVGTIRHWNGSSWSSVESNTLASLIAVWGDGPDHTRVVVGHTEGAGKLLLCGNSDCLAGKIGLVPKLNCVWGSGPDDVWAGGDDGTMIHFSGVAFTMVATASTASIRGLWGSGPNDVWAVGDANTIQHWDGTAWSLVVGGQLFPELNGIWGIGPDEIWAVGDGGYGGALARWDGQTWSYPRSQPNLVAHAVWASGSTDVWVLAERGIILHTDEFGLFSGPRQADLPGIMNGIWGSAPGDVWTVGWAGTVGAVFRHRP